MGMLHVLQSRLEDDPPDGEDGYFVRTKDNVKMGPMSGATACRTQTLRALRARVLPPRLTQRPCSARPFSLCAENHFEALRSSEDISKIASAWRMAGGNFYKISLNRGIVCDADHLFSLQAIGHACELVVLVLCFGATGAVFLMVSRSEQLARERQQAGEGTWLFLEVMFMVTIVMMILTVRKLVQRWRKASTDVFVSEV